MTENVTLSPRQRKALAAIIQCRSLKEAAETCGLSEKTLYRYMANPEFRRALSQAEGDLIDETGRRLIHGQEKALQVLEDLISKAESEHTKRLAAEAWLTFTLRWRELKLEERLAALEEFIYGNHET